MLCKEGLLGHRGYWEVEYDGWVVIGVVSESSPRKMQDGPCGIGENKTSWGAGWSGSCCQIWHNAENVDIQMPLSSTMGVYVDQPAGIIKFLLVEGEAEKEVRLIHKFKENLQEKVFPGFWVGTNSFCLIRKKDQWYSRRSKSGKREGGSRINLKSRGRWGSCDVWGTSAVTISAFSSAWRKLIGFRQSPEMPKCHTNRHLSVLFKLRRMGI